MKEIGHIYLSWREGKGKQRHIVGVLKRNITKGVSFKYIKKGVLYAKKHGFTTYTEFPDLDKIYSENVLEIFGQRIMKSERTDILEFYNFWNINPKYKTDNFYLLALTQGLTPTDNFEFLADFNPKKNLSFITDLANLSNLELSKNSVNIGDILSYKLEIENKYDNKAVKIFKENIEVGFIKKIHSRVFHKIKKNQLKLKVIAIEQNGIIKRIFVQVSI